MPPSCRTKSRWNQQHWIYSGERQVTSEAWSMLTYRSSPKGQPLHQRKFLRQQPANDSESPKVPSSTFTPNSTTWCSTLLYEPNSTHSTLLNPTLHNNYSNPSSGISPQSATRSTPSPLSRFNPKDSPPEGRRMKPGHNTPWNRGSPGTKNKHIHLYLDLNDWIIA